MSQNHSKKEWAHRAAIARVAWCVTITLVVAGLLCIGIYGIVAGVMSGGDKAVPHLGWLMGLGFICILFSFASGYAWNCFRGKANGPY